MNINIHVLKITQAIRFIFNTWLTYMSGLRRDGRAIYYVGAVITITTSQKAIDSVTKGM